MEKITWHVFRRLQTVIKSYATLKIQLRFPHFQHPSHSRLFAVLLMLASQRIESVMDFTGETSYDETSMPEKRGAAPTLIEMFILSWVSGKSSTIFIVFSSISTSAIRLVFDLSQLEITLISLVRKLKAYLRAFISPLSLAEEHSQAHYHLIHFGLC